MELGHLQQAAETVEVVSSFVVALIGARFEDDLLSPLESQTLVVVAG